MRIGSALVTDDFRAYHALAPRFEKAGLNLLGLHPGEEIPPNITALINGPDGDPRTVPLLSPAATLLACLEKLEGTTWKRAIFGVDPGKVIGLAVLCDGKPMMVHQAHSIKGARKVLRDWATALPSRITVHVGDGNGPEWADAFPDWPTHLVPEHNTSPAGPVTGSKHMDAAVLIGLRKPRP